MTDYREALRLELEPLGAEQTKRYVQLIARWLELRESTPRAVGILDDYASRFSLGVLRSLQKMILEEHKDARLRAWASRECEDYIFVRTERFPAWVSGEPDKKIREELVDYFNHETRTRT